MFLTVDDARLFTASFGPRTAPALLALGGWIGSWEDWVQPLSPLSDHWHTLAYDHRGCGITTAPVESLTYDRLVDDVFAVLDAYQVERCVLAAMSAGTLVALGAVLRHPARFTGLVIANGVAHRTTPLDQDRFLALLQADYPRALEQFVQACIPEPDCEHIKQWGRHILRRAGQESAVALWKLVAGIDLRPDLSRITLPTLLLHGDQDAVVPLAEAEALARALPLADLVVLRGAGHVPSLTRPQAVATEIDRFMQRVTV